MGHVSAYTDPPAAAIVNETIAAYPEAKVILVERDIDKWYKRHTQSVIKSISLWTIAIVTRIDPVYVWPIVRLIDLTTEYHFSVKAKREKFWCVRDPVYFKEWARNSKAAYLAHNDHVKCVTPPERLLLFKPEQGWGPLHEFLGKPVPYCPFPNVNDAEALKEKIVMYRRRGSERPFQDCNEGVAFLALLLSALMWRS